MNRIFSLSTLIPLLVAGFIYEMYVYSESEFLLKAGKKVKVVIIFIIYIVQEFLLIFISDRMTGTICFQYSLGVSAFMLSRKYAGAMVLTTPMLVNLYLLFIGQANIWSLYIAVISVVFIIAGMRIIVRRTTIQDLFQYFFILFFANITSIEPLDKIDQGSLVHFYYGDVTWAVVFGSCLIFALTFLFFHEFDIKRQKIKQLVYEESHDKLTGLRNYRQFRRELDRIEEKSDLAYIILMLDIDDFKIINDTYGHTEGNAVLKYFADELKAWRRYVQKETNKRVKLFRFGGEEFLVLIENMEIDDVFCRIELFKKEFSTHDFVTEDGQHFEITFSGGITDARETTSIRLAVKFADEALYAAKSSGKKRVVKRSQHSLVVSSKALRNDFMPKESYGK
ncbi:GGDEF domain-containing protein [Liquorilactobacillus oeni]|uniref:Response regulator n=1 Tax=Liquorilactobacillus oeni DSM 19972 TaxID=1423777 RepID=A0A0R1M8H7_9LACO|nr:GGDEF domain-containing protein [Liquorilactobacillus oeni]KRL04496.1 response regulator [Liquorilactobacillus oeni DSM 19972]